MSRCGLLVLALVYACGAAGDRAPTRTLVAFNAGSLARPMRAALDSFAVREGVQVQQESAGSLETARKLTELGKIPDVIALADEDVFAQFLMPDQATWYAQFARNRMVLAYTSTSRGADRVNDATWWRILLTPGVETGRSDPQLDPNGYRTLMVLQLAERHYGEAGLAKRLLEAMPPRNVRPKEADLVGLLQAGELDYIWSYESMARSIGLSFVRLPDRIDLSSPADSAFYAESVVRVRGKGSDSVTFRGRPIVYALSIPTAAPHPEVAEAFVKFLLSADGRRVLHAEGLDVLDAPVFVGSRAPAGVVP
jgi:molybdate/tungstate transport system substrate-binding protein